MLHFTSLTRHELRGLHNTTWRAELGQTKLLCPVWCPRHPGDWASCCSRCGDRAVDRGHASKLNSRTSKR